MTFKERNKGFTLRLLAILVLINCTFAENSGIPREVNLDSETQPLLLLVEDAAYDKRNNVNRFKNLMINKDVPERLDYDARDEQIYYIPRIASGKKRDNVFAVPGAKVRFGASNLRSFRPAP